MTDTPENDLPEIDELDRVAFDAVVRSAPRFGRFVGTGVGVGVVLGFILGFALPNSTSVGRGVVGLLLALGFGMVAAIVTGAIVTRVDGTKAAPSGQLPWDDAVAPAATFTPVTVTDSVGSDDAATTAPGADGAGPEDPSPRVP